MIIPDHTKPLVTEELNENHPHRALYALAYWADLLPLGGQDRADLCAWLRVLLAWMEQASANREHNVLAVLDHYREQADEAAVRLARVRAVVDAARLAVPLLPPPCDCQDSICRGEQALAAPLRAALAALDGREP